MGREEEEEKRCVNIRFIMIDDVVRHFFRPQPSVRPSCHHGRVQTSSASMSVAARRESVQGEKSNKSVGQYLYLLMELKTACSPRHFLHNKSRHGAPARPRPCLSPSIHHQRTAIFISSHSLRLAVKRPESKIEQNNVLSATLRM